MCGTVLKSVGQAWPEKFNVMWKWPNIRRTIIQLFWREIQISKLQCLKVLLCGKWLWQNCIFWVSLSMATHGKVTQYDINAYFQNWIFAQYLFSLCLDSLCRTFWPHWIPPGAYINYFGLTANVWYSLSSCSGLTCFSRLKNKGAIHIIFELSLTAWMRIQRSWSIIW